MEIAPITLKRQLAWRLGVAGGVIALLFVAEAMIRIYLNCSQSSTVSGWGLMRPQTCRMFTQGWYHGEVFNMASSIAARQFVKVSIVSLLCALIFHREVTRHISAVAQFLNQATSQDRSAHLSLFKTCNPVSELADIEKGLNGMVGRLNEVVDEDTSLVRQSISKIEFDRMSATCEAVTSILHDVNNGLSVISNSPARIEHLMELDHGVNHVTREAVSKVLESHERIVSMMAKLISTQQGMVTSHGKMTKISLVGVVGDAIEIEGMRLVRAGIALKRDQLMDFQVRGYHEVYLSILLNLLKNAREAIVTADSAERFVCLSSWLDGDTVVLEIRDSGCGIAPDSLKVVGTYGVSTKTTGHGFGLAGARRMLADMGGSLSVDSPGVGKGTQIQIGMQTAS